MPAASLITREEALRLGEVTGHDEVLALVDRAWTARQERFGRLDGERPPAAAPAVTSGLPFGH
jgi:hypothetical protein